MQIVTNCRYLSVPDYQRNIVLVAMVTVKVPSEKFEEREEDETDDAFYGGSFCAGKGAGEGEMEWFQ